MQLKIIILNFNIMKFRKYKIYKFYHNILSNSAHDIIYGKSWKSLPLTNTYLSVPFIFAQMVFFIFFWLSLSNLLMKIRHYFIRSRKMQLAFWWCCKLKIKKNSSWNFFLFWRFFFVLSSKDLIKFLKLCLVFNLLFVTN